TPFFADVGKLRQRFEMVGLQVKDALERLCRVVPFPQSPLALAQPQKDPRVFRFVGPTLPVELQRSLKIADFQKALSQHNAGIRIVVSTGTMLEGRLQNRPGLKRPVLQQVESATKTESETVFRVTAENGIGHGFGFFVALCLRPAQSQGK